MGQCIEDKRFYFVGKERERKVNVELLISRYIEGIPRKDILEEFGISVGVLYKIENEKDFERSHSMES